MEAALPSLSRVYTYRRNVIIYNVKFKAFKFSVMWPVAGTNYRVLLQECGFVYVSLKRYDEVQLLTYVASNNRSVASYQSDGCGKKST